MENLYRLNALSLHFLSNKLLGLHLLSNLDCYPDIKHGGVVVPLDIFAACVWLIFPSLGQFLFHPQ